MRYLTPIFFFVFCFLSVAKINGQHHSKAKINLIGRDIQELAKAGIETDHGLFVKNRYFVSDFSPSEMAIIRQLNFEVDILIENVNEYYADPTRKSELGHHSWQLKDNCDGQQIAEYNYQTPSQYKPGTMGGYFTYKEMLDILDSMAVRYPLLISKRTDIDTITTHQNNRLFYIKLSDNVMQEEIGEPKVLYTALHHAREPNGLSQMIFYVWYLLENYGSDPTVTKIVNQTQLYFVPCVNPDGYQQNQVTNPAGGGLWRKNMWKDEEGKLKGVDLNRNYGHYWGYDDVGSSNNPNSQTFRGKSGFSEPETRSLRNLCLVHDFKIALNYHTFGNFLIHPWGYNDEPTDEDILFKSMGRVINKENSFSMGTGSETVGYTVNGDSDDWMYGEVAEKNKIYSFTPEVGPSFWPPAVDIDYLNRSCVWMNLHTALLTLSYYEALESASSSFLSPEKKTIEVTVTRAGLKDGSSRISLSSTTPGVSVVTPDQWLTLPKGEVAKISFELNIDESLDYPGGISFELLVDNEGLITSTPIKKKWIGDKLSTLFFDPLTKNDGFVSEGWNISDKSFYSQPTSVTDSEEGDYPPNYSATITTKQAVDLSKAEFAVLQFYAKWDLENNYDFVQVQASADNVNFIPLCGKYTNPGVPEQEFNSPLYDGTQSQWVKEEIDLTAFCGRNKVWIRFVIRTDAYEERDGFYFDDLEIKANSVRVNTDNISQNQATLVPTVITGNEVCHIKGIETGQEALRLLLMDVMGNVVYTGGASGQIDLNRLSITNGVYFYEIKEGNLLRGSGKLTVVK